jgi:hypothetical protein
LGFTMRCKTLESILYWVDFMREEKMIPWLDFIWIEQWTRECGAPLVGSLSK